jgi:hypothetical protein
MNRTAHTSAPRQTGKYRRNSAGKFDCPVRGCNRRGALGLDNPQGVGAHLRTAHPGYLGNGGTNGSRENPPAVADPVAEADADVAGTLRTPASAAFRRAADIEATAGTGFATPPPLARGEASERLTDASARVTMGATEAVVAILGLREVRGLNPAQLKGVFEAVTTIRRLDATTTDERTEQQQQQPAPGEQEPFDQR